MEALLNGLQGPLHPWLCPCLSLMPPRPCPLPPALQELRNAAVERLAAIEAAVAGAAAAQAERFVSAKQLLQVRLGLAGRAAAGCFLTPDAPSRMGSLH